MLSWYNHRQAKREFISAVKLNSFLEPKLLVFFFFLPIDPTIYVSFIDLASLD